MINFKAGQNFNKQNSLACMRFKGTQNPSAQLSFKGAEAGSQNKLRFGLSLLNKNNQLESNWLYKNIGNIEVIEDSKTIDSEYVYTSVCANANVNGVIYKIAITYDENGNFLGLAVKSDDANGFYYNPANKYSETHDGFNGKYNNLTRKHEGSINLGKQKHIELKNMFAELIDPLSEKSDLYKNKDNLKLVENSVKTSKTDLDKTTEAEIIAGNTTYKVYLINIKGKKSLKVTNKDHIDSDNFNYSNNKTEHQGFYGTYPEGGKWCDHVLDKEKIEDFKDELVNLFDPTGNKGS